MVTKKTVLLGMSGGVDSSIVAYLLQKQGYHVIGITMQIYAGGVERLSLAKSGCYGPASKEGIAAAKKVAERFSIEHYVVPLMDEYHQEVLGYFRSEYLKGRTPNPCVRCNQMIKFGFMLKKAQELGIEYDFFATGHYCRLVRDEKQVSLRRALDSKKDQSYFLSRLKKEQLENLIFPLGDLTKEEVKAVAREIGFEELAEKKESQDFIAADSYSVLFKPEDLVAGDIKDLSGKVLGKHAGLVNYTIGQRKGIGLGGGATPLYVVGIDTEKNVLTVGGKEALFAEEFFISDSNWFISDVLDHEEFTAQVKIRQTARPVQATIYKISETNIFRVRFEQPQTAVTAGQVAVFYLDDCLIGSGIIETKL